VGCSGSGKTTLGRALARSLNCPHVELDAIFHQPGWTELRVDEFKARVRDAASEPCWVIDGNYSVVQEIVWDRADTVIWFDLSYGTVMSRVARRTLRRAILRTELWNGNREPWSNLLSLNPQKSIVAWTANRHGLYRRRYSAAQTDPRWSDVTFLRLRSASAVRQLMGNISSGSLQEGAR
jgi:adenylate kinase family enzyme